MKKKIDNDVIIEMPINKIIKAQPNKIDKSFSEMLKMLEEIDKLKYFYFDSRKDINLFNKIDL